MEVVEATRHVEGDLDAELPGERVGGVDEVEQVADLRELRHDAEGVHADAHHAQEVRVI